MHIEHDIEHFVRMLNMETSEGKREWETGEARQRAYMTPAM